MIVLTCQSPPSRDSCYIFKKKNWGVLVLKSLEQIKQLLSQLHSCRSCSWRHHRPEYLNDHRPQVPDKAKGTTHVDIVWCCRVESYVVGSTLSNLLGECHALSNLNKTLSLFFLNAKDKSSALSWPFVSLWSRKIQYLVETRDTQIVS